MTDEQHSSLPPDAHEASPAAEATEAPLAAEISGAAEASETPGTGEPSEEPVVEASVPEPARAEDAPAEMIPQEGTPEEAEATESGAAEETSRQETPAVPGAVPAPPAQGEATQSVAMPLERALPTIIQEMMHPEDQRLTYRITLPAFDGPMELMLHLIKEHEVDIYDIPIALITREYLAVLDLMQALNLDIAGDFLVMAATLMQIKSRMLLPVEPTTDGEEPEDPRAELVRRLLEYKQFKDAADRLGDMEKERGRIFPRNVPEEWKEGGEEEHLVEVTLFGLLNAFKDVLIHAQKDFSTELIRPEITVTQKINDLMDMLQEQREVKFIPLLTACRTKLEKIVTFLALLELVRLKLVKAYQGGAFQEIRLFLAENGPQTPAAGLANPEVPGMVGAERSFDDAEFELRAEEGETSTGEAAEPAEEAPEGKHRRSRRKKRRGEDEEAVPAIEGEAPQTSDAPDAEAQDAPGHGRARKGRKKSRRGGHDAETPAGEENGTDPGVEPGEETQE